MTCSALSMAVGSKHKRASCPPQASPSGGWGNGLGTGVLWVAKNPRIELSGRSPKLIPMTIEELRRSVAQDAAPPPTSSRPVQALWHAARGDWHAAHACAQDDKSRDGSWVHAYLHRQEGDLGNAGYWYSRAGRPMPAAKISLETEWAELAGALLPGKNPPTR